MTDLGRLSRVNLRDTWENEARDFTPWLARDENLSLLSETLGMALEREAVEKNVGPFKADILCRDPLSDTWVLIENQLERTDHTHLGQLITYAAGLKAVTIVWIAASFTAEHRAALDWLNEITETEVRFFALEVELWKIGDSLAAPKFNLVCQPNDWSREAHRARIAIENELTPARALQLEYWSAFEALLDRSATPVRAVKPQAQSWMWHALGRTGTGVNTSMNTLQKWIRVEIYLDGDAATGNFHFLDQQRAEIEAELGATLDWQELEGRQAKRICLALTDADPMRRGDWNRQHQWLLDWTTRFHNTFAPRILQIDPEAARMLS